MKDQADRPCLEVGSHAGVVEEVRPHDLESGHALQWQSRDSRARISRVGRIPAAWTPAMTVIQAIRSLGGPSPQTLIVESSAPRGHSVKSRRSSPRPCPVTGSGSGPPPPPAAEARGPAAPRVGPASSTSVVSSSSPRSVLSLDRVCRARCPSMAAATRRTPVISEPSTLAIVAIAAAGKEGLSDLGAARLRPCLGGGTARRGVLHQGCVVDREVEVRGDVLCHVGGVTPRTPAPRPRPP